MIRGGGRPEGVWRNGRGRERRHRGRYLEKAREIGTEAGKVMGGLGVDTGGSSSREVIEKGAGLVGGVSRGGGSYCIEELCGGPVVEVSRSSCAA